MQMYRPFTFAICSLLASFPLLAEDETEIFRDTVALRGITVTAPYKTDVLLTPLDVTVVSREEIDRSTESSLLPVLMHKVPGMFVSERGFAGYGVSGGAAGTVNIRGVGGGNKVLFMVDGQPVWAGLFGHALPDTYVANGVESVEVVKGPSSLLYGSSAMGGSVNIKTRRQHTDGASGKARAMFGSFSTQKFNLSTGYRKDKFSMTVAGQLDRSDGNREGSEFWLANEYIQAQYEASSHWSFGANTEMTQTKANNPGTIQEPLESMWTKVARGTASVYANDTYDSFHGGLQAFASWGSHHVDDGHAPGADPRDYIFRSTDYNMGFTLFQTVNPWENNDLSVGLDFLHWGGHSWNVLKADGAETASFRKCENEVAGYVMMQQGFWGDRFSLNGGVRLQHGSQYGNVWVPQAGLIFRPSATGHIKFSFGKGFRAPNLRELYMYAPANPDLKPEYMLNYELSYRQTLLDNRLSLGAALYFIDGKDMIQVQRIDGRPKNVNTGKFKNKGFELEAGYRFNDTWSIDANYAYLHTDNSTLLYAPKNKLDAEINWNPGPFRFTLEDSSIWSLQTGNPDKKENYTLLNFRGAYTYGERVPVTFFVKLDNILDTDYEIVYGCPMPGITILGGVEFSF